MGNGEEVRPTRYPSPLSRRAPGRKEEENRIACTTHPRFRLGRRESTNSPSKNLRCIKRSIFPIQIPFNLKFAHDIPHFPPPSCTEAFLSSCRTARGQSSFFPLLLLLHFLSFLRREGCRGEENCAVSEGRTLPSPSPPPPPPQPTTFTNANKREVRPAAAAAAAAAEKRVRIGWERGGSLFTSTKREGRPEKTSSSSSFPFCTAPFCISLPLSAGPPPLSGLHLRFFATARNSDNNTFRA